ncbi:hypothetical protein X900_4647 [Burkholderia pseudomallei BDU 2]|nr:hypothetical protein X900_4647 [Burkholderia pseudomallei BDU 2]
MPGCVAASGRRQHAEAAAVGAPALEHDGPVAVQEHPPLDECLHGARERDAFDVAPHREQLFGPVRVIDALDHLLDDRPLVEVVGHEVRGRADQLHAASMRLMVRLRALEPRQERVMDVDRAIREPRARFRRQHLHVAREDHELGAARLEHVEPLGLLLRLRVGRDREVPERQPVLRGERREIRMIRHDPDDVHLQLAHFPAEQQIGEAMLELRHHDQHLRPRGDVVNRPLHPEALGDRFELASQRVDAQRVGVVGRMEHATHEKARAEVVVEDGQLVDVAAMPVEQADDGGDLARGART